MLHFSYSYLNYNNAKIHTNNRHIRSYIIKYVFAGKNIWIYEQNIGAHFATPKLMLNIMNNNNIVYGTEYSTIHKVIYASIFSHKIKHRYFIIIICISDPTRFFSCPPQIIYTYVCTYTNRMGWTIVVGTWLLRN